MPHRLRINNGHLEVGLIVPLPLVDPTHRTAPIAAVEVADSVSAVVAETLITVLSISRVGAGARSFPNSNKTSPGV